MAKRKAISKRTRFSIFARDNFTCIYCGRQPPSIVLHVEHVIPVSRGGTNDEFNLKTACSDCNMGKGARVFGENMPVAVANKETEMIAAAKIRLRETRSALRTERRINQSYINWICDIFGAEEIAKATLTIVKNLVSEFGEVLVGEWLSSSARRVHYEVGRVKYLCGIARNKREVADEMREMEEEVPLA